MTDDLQYSFRMQRESWKSQHLIYEEPQHRLAIYLEMSGVKEFHWVGSEVELEMWDVPAGEQIPEEKRKQILNRLAKWSREYKIRIGIGPPVDMNEYFAEYERKGWTVVHNPDRTTTVSRPKQESLFTRIMKRFKQNNI